jgi:hypothetical protein
MDVYYRGVRSEQRKKSGNETGKVTQTFFFDYLIKRSKLSKTSLLLFLSSFLKVKKGVTALSAVTPFLSFRLL